MTPRKPYEPGRQPWPDHWAVTTEFKLRGQWLRPGITQLKIKGERGRFRFLRYVYNTATGTEWLDVVGGSDPGTPREVVMLRAFRPQRVTRVLHTQ